jgi:hypothetical protein
MRALPMVVNQLRRPTRSRSFFVSVHVWLQKVIVSMATTAKLEMELQGVCPE